MNLQEEINRIKELSGFLKENLDYLSYSDMEDEPDDEFIDDIIDDYENDDSEDEEDVLMAADEFFSKSPEYRINSLRDMDMDSEEDVDFSKVKRNYSPIEINYEKGNTRDYPERSDVVWKMSEK